MNIQCSWCNETVTKLGDLSSVSEVGAGLFLGLAVVQLIGAGQITRLQRKATRLRTAINTNHLNGLRNAIKLVDSEILRAERSLEDWSPLALGISFIFLVGALCGLSVVSLCPDIELTACWVAAVLFYFLALPLLCFLVATVVIRRNCVEAERSLKACSKQVSDVIARS